MNTIPWSAILAVTLAAVLSLMLGWLFGRRGKSNAPLGLPEGSVRGILAITVTVAVLIYPAFSSLSVPDFLENAFLLIIGLYFGNRTASPAAPSPSAPTATTQPPKAPSVGEPLPERNSGGFIRLPTFMVLLACGALVFGILLIGTGCAGTKLGDGQIGNTGIDAKPVAKFGLAAAERFGGDKLKPYTTGAKTFIGDDEPAAPAGELVSDGFFDLSGNPLVNGVRRVKTYRAIEEIAPPVAVERRPASNVPPAAEPSAPSSSVGEPVSSGAGGATYVPTPQAQTAKEKTEPARDAAATAVGTSTLPQPTQVRNSSTTGPTTSGPAQVLGARGTSSITTARLVQVEARIASVESPLAAEVSNATAVVELLLNDQGNGALLVSGRVLEITNTAAAAPLDLKRLHFDDVAASVSEQGLVTAASEPGAEIQFEASLDADGNLRATAVPAAGSPAALFFQRLEVSGRPLLNQNVVITNAPAQPVSEGILRGARWNGFPRVDLDAPELLTRTKVEIIRGTPCVGMLKVNGKKAEWIAQGRQWSSVKNIIHDPSYFQDIKSGDTVEISIADLDGRNESNRVRIIWP